MKTKTFISMIIAMLTLGLATTASATEFGSGFPTFNLSIGGTAMYGGELVTTFTGDSGHNNLAKEGGAGTDITAGLSGNGCTDCSNTDITANQVASEHLNFAGEAGGEQANSLVSNENVGVGQAGVGLTVNDTTTQAGGLVGFAGKSFGQFDADGGYVHTTQQGGGGINILQTYAGGGCDTPECANSTLDMNAYSWNTNTSSGVASSNTPGGVTSLVNGGQAITNVQLMHGTAPAATADSDQ